MFFFPLYSKEFFIGINTWKFFTLINSIHIASTSTSNLVGYTGSGGILHVSSMAHLHSNDCKIERNIETENSEDEARQNNYIDKNCSVQRFCTNKVRGAVLDIEDLLSKAETININPYSIQET